MAPTVSIIVPVYDTVADLRRCLDSLLAQTLRDIEVVGVDDGSTDGSADVLREYAAKDPRVVAIFQENRGVEWARAVAMERARGRYVMFCDSDDAYLPRMCEAMVGAVEANGTDLAVCGFDPVGWTNRYYLDNAVPEASPRASARAVWHNVWLWNKIFRREVIDRTGLAFPRDPGIRRGYDAVFTFLYSLAVDGATFLPDRLVRHYRREGSITSHRRNGSLRSTLDDAGHLPGVLDFVDRNGFYAAKRDLVLRWIDFRVGKSFEFCNEGQRAEAIRRFADALSSRGADIGPEFPWLREVLARDERAVARHLDRVRRGAARGRGFPQRIADGITVVLERLGLRVWLRGLLFGRPPAPDGAAGAPGPADPSRP